ncbi:site-specific integrase [uncultured Bacteroides sp.]|uniref:site-specific integrase n=1 Tax=uncultured Bacteroides sp. TaxID=162156 RepID=UPI002601C98A|nr:site-specific integrase [uncultured Bacteroides sp.]
MQKIRYRLVYNRKHQLNRQGTALVQVEAKLNQRNIYLTTNIYLQPGHWDTDTAQVVNHPQAIELNAMLFEFIIHLQAIELGFWKRGIQPTLALLRDAVRKKAPTTITFLAFARSAIETSDKRANTKENLLSTVTQLEQFRPGLDFADLNYTMLKDFESWLREQGKGVNTVAKHLRQLRTLCNEAINDGYMQADAYPFRKYKIRQEKGKHEFLTPDELQRLESVVLADGRHRHVLDAFLFCCYTGLRYSDFVALTTSNLVLINRKKWLFLKMQKTNIEIKLPLQLLYDGKSLQILYRYPSIEELAAIPSNCETNRLLSEIGKLAGVKKHFTYHTARHTCATLLVHQGVPITTVQKVLGHTSVKTTQIYSEVLSDTIVRDLKSIRKRKRL